jgi:hypothetical protein
MNSGEVRMTTYRRRLAQRNRLLQKESEGKMI